VLGVYNIDASVLASGEAVFENDKALLNCLEHVSYVKISIWLAVQQNAHVAELEEANARLLAELKASRCHEQALTSDYEGLRRDFDICALHTTPLWKKKQI
jgi:hypothetical protein